MQKEPGLPSAPSPLLPVLLIPNTKGGGASRSTMVLRNTTREMTLGVTAVSAIAARKARAVLRDQCIALA